MLAALGGDAVLLVELGLIIGALGLLARLAERWRFSAIPLYLLVGVALGIGGEGPLSFSPDVIEIGAEIGLVLLLFMLGLEYGAEEFVGGLRRSLRSGALDLALNFTPGLAAGLLLGWDPLAAVLLGGVTYISSSGLISKLITDLGRTANRETPPVLSLLVIEDLVMALYLPLVGVGLGDDVPLVAAAVVVISLLAVAGMLRLSLSRGPALSRLVASRSDEALLLTVLGAVLLVAGLAEAIQLSAPVGAFLLGIAFSGSIVPRARGVLAPLRDLFAAAFFIFFGLEIEVAALPDVAVAALALAVVTAAGKIAVGWQAAGEAGAGTAGRLRAGTALIARGEFSIVIAGLGVAAGLESQLGALAAGYVLITAFAGSLATRGVDPLLRRIEGGSAHG